MRRSFLPILFLVATAATAGAQQAPLNLSPTAQPPARAGAAPAAPTAPPQTAAPAVETPQQMIERINRSLNAVTYLSGDFTQVNADGRRRTGKLFVARPGRLKFEYDRPLRLEVVSDGSNVAVIDGRLGTQDVYGINQTPLKFLVRERVDITKDTTVRSVRREGDMVVLDIEDRNTVTGTSKIRLSFNAADYQLRRWTITDPQGAPTTVILSNLDTQRRPDRSMFVINYQFNAGPRVAN